MKISIRQLRHIIREELIREAGMNVSDALNSGMALYSTSNTQFETFVLYRAFGDDSIFKSLSDGLMDTPSAVRQSIVGVVRVAKKSGGIPAYIDGVRAKQGWGPLMYDIALRYHGPLQPSPESVSSDAQKVWDYYRKNRSTKKGDTEYKAASGGNPTQLQLKSRTSVNVVPLKDNHNEIYARLRMSNKTIEREGEFYARLENDLYRIGNEYLSTLNM